MEKEIDMERRMTVVEERSKSNKHRLDSLEKIANSFGDLVAEVKVIASGMTEIKSDVNKLDEKVDKIEKKPGQRYETLIGNVVWAIVAAVITYVLSHFGL